jgi:uncharacterized protein (TIGR03435 family)
LVFPDFSFSFRASVAELPGGAQFCRLLRAAELAGENIFLKFVTRKIGVPLALMAGAAFGLEQRLTFEAASVKADPSLSVRHVLLPPVGGRLSTRMAPLRLLIESAYGVQSFQISGGPDWMDSSGFDIEAKAAGNPSRSEVWLMLRSLLEDRFGLKAHRETQVQPVYALTVAKGGLKLPKATEGECVNAPPPAGQRPLGPCGYVTVAFEPAAGLDIEGRQVGMAELARQLSAMLQRPVVDETGFAGKFDVNLRFAYEADVTVGIGDPWRGVADGSGNPTIMGGLQQLGLRLETSKGPVEMLVIDRAERPTEN